MSSHGSVTSWIAQVRTGDQAAAQKLWERYLQRLMALAKKMLGTTSRRLEDEEDVVLKVFECFFRRAARGHYPNLNDRDDLWWLLVNLTNLNVQHIKRREGGRGRKEVGESALGRPDSSDVAGNVPAQDPEPTPAEAAELADGIRQFMAFLSDDSLRQVLLFKLEGYTNKEIAQRMECVERTVERKSRTLRHAWDEFSREGLSGSSRQTQGI